MAFDFKPTVDTLDGVPSEFHGLYVAAEGGKGFNFHPDFKAHVHGLTTALDKERKAAREFKTTLQAWQQLGETPEAAQTKLQELEAAAAKAGDNSKALDKFKQDLEAGYGKKLQAKDAEVSAMRTTVEKYLVDMAATSALAEAKGSVTLLLPHVKSSVRVMEENGNYVVRVVDKDGDPRGDGKGGFMTIADLVAEMKTSEAFARAFEASGASGSGKSASSSKPAATARREDMSPIDKIRAGLARK